VLCYALKRTCTNTRLGKSDNSVVMFVALGLALCQLPKVILPVEGRIFNELRFRQLVGFSKCHGYRDVIIGCRSDTNLSERV
jgi:hypothetical protein